MLQLAVPAFAGAGTPVLLIKEQSAFASWHNMLIAVPDLTVIERTDSVTSYRVASGLCGVLR